MNLGVLYDDMGEYDKAKHHAKLAIELSEDNEVCLLLCNGIPNNSVQV